MNNPVLLYDGICNLCNSSIRFILTHEADQALKFASMQSAAGQELLSKFGISKLLPESILLIKDGKIFEKSDAALKISAHLNTPWCYLQKLKFIPAFIRNGVYDLIAQNRYRLFGKKEVCWIPDEKWRNRFL